MLSVFSKNFLNKLLLLFNILYEAFVTFFWNSKRILCSSSLTIWFSLLFLFFKLKKTNFDKRMNDSQKRADAELLRLRVALSSSRKLSVCSKKIRCFSRKFIILEIPALSAIFAFWALMFVSWAASGLIEKKTFRISLLNKLVGFYLQSPLPVKGRFVIPRGTNTRVSWWGTFIDCHSHFDLIHGAEQKRVQRHVGSNDLDLPILERMLHFTFDLEQKRFDLRTSGFPFFFFFLSEDCS